MKILGTLLGFFIIFFATIFLFTSFVTFICLVNDIPFANHGFSPFINAVIISCIPAAIFSIVITITWWCCENDK